MTAPTPIAPADAQALFDALLHSVSHDLRSPLLTMSLSADLIEDALQQEGVTVESGAVGVALNALRHGATDLERMLQALTLVARARRRPMERSRAPLRLVLGGYAFRSDLAGLEDWIVTVDPIVVREAIDAALAEAACELHVRIDGSCAVIEVECVMEPAATSPLGALANSLQSGAGTLVERLAVPQVLIERQGGAVRCADGRLALWLPIEVPA